MLPESVWGPWDGVRMISVVSGAGKRRRGNPEALARLAKRAKPAAFDDEGPADEPQVDTSALVAPQHSDASVLCCNIA